MKSNKYNKKSRYNMLKLILWSHFGIMANFSNILQDIQSCTRFLSSQFTNNTYIEPNQTCPSLVNCLDNCLIDQEFNICSDNCNFIRSDFWCNLIDIIEYFCLTVANSTSCITTINSSTNTTVPERLQACMPIEDDCYNDLNCKIQGKCAKSCVDYDLNYYNMTADETSHFLWCITNCRLIFPSDIQNKAFNCDFSARITLCNENNLTILQS